MRLPFFLTATLVGLSVVSCSPEGEVSVVGKVDGADTLIVYKIGTQSVESIDTVLLSGGFRIHLPTDSGRVTFYNLQFNTGASVRIGLSPDDNPVLTIDATKNLASYSVSGSPTSLHLLRLYEPLRNAMEQVDSLDIVNAQFRDSTNYIEIKKGLNILFGQILEQHRSQLIQAMEKDTTSIANIFAFYQGIGRGSTLDPRYDFPIFEKTDRRLQALHPKHPIVKRFHNDVHQLKEAFHRGSAVSSAQKTLVPGAPVPPIEGKTPQGNSLTLSSLRGKIILLDVWASWCVPCRTQNRRWTQLMEHYESKNWTIVSYSLDGTPKQENARQDWTKAISDDRLSWTNHASRLQGWEDPIVSQLGIDQLPFSLLIDEQGRLIAKNPTDAQILEVIGQ